MPCCNRHPTGGAERSAVHTAQAIEAPSRHIPAPSAHKLAALNAAETDERFWADVDTFADWLYAQCLAAGPQRIDATLLPKTARGLTELVEASTVPMLVALSLYPRSDVRAVATWHIRERYYDAMHDYRRRIGDIVAAESAEE